MILERFHNIVHLFLCPQGIDELLFTESQREFYKKKFSDVLVAYADLAVEEKAIGEG